MNSLKSFLFFAGAWAFFFWGHPAGILSGMESRYLPEAEALIARGETEEGFRLYEEAMRGAEGWPEKILLTIPLGRAALLNGNWQHLSETLVVGPEDPWQRGLMGALLRHYLGDNRAALDSLASLSDGNPPEEWRHALQAWTEQIRAALEIPPHGHGDWSSHPPTGPVDGQSPEALFHARDVSGLRQHLRTEGEAVGNDPEFWRIRLPVLRDMGLLEELASAAVPGWKAVDGWKGAFALGELRLFAGDPAGAKEHFRDVVRLPETREAEDNGMAMFRRLNLAFHNRHAAKYRIGLALGTYGSRPHLDFAFLGLRQDPAPSNTGEARDAALIYLKELNGWRNGEPFLEEVRGDLAGFPHLCRIMAFAALYAPFHLVEEVEAFARSPVVDTLTAEFSLTALNRLVLSTRRFPELTGRMSRLAEDMDGKFAPGRTDSSRARHDGMRRQIQRRLGTWEEDTVVSIPSPDTPDGMAAQISQAIDEGNPEEAEEWLRRLAQVGEVPFGTELAIARTWAVRQNGETRAARLVAQFLNGLLRPSPGGSRPISFPWRWREPMPFPPPNPYLSGDRFEMMQELAGLATGTILDALIDYQTGTEGRPEAGIESAAWFARALLLAWDGRPERAVRHLEEGFRATGDGNLGLLAAYLDASHGSFAAVAELLESLSLRADPTGREAARLSFAMAVYQSDSARLGELAEGWRQRDFSPKDALELARGLALNGHWEAAAAWLERIPPLALADSDLVDWRETMAGVAIAQGANGEAVRLARITLLERLPIYFEDLGGDSRNRALEILKAAGGLEEYLSSLAELLTHAPRSVSVHLLLGEAHDFLWRQRERAGQEGGHHKEDARRHHHAAAQTLLHDGEMFFQYIHWLAWRGWWEEAAEALDHLLKVDVVSALLDRPMVYDAYARAGRLEAMLDFLVVWRAPEAPDCLDNFYGLQPTEHLFHPLGVKFLEMGQAHSALKAWETGLRNNPREFTEEMRVSLVANLLTTVFEPERALEAVVDYVAENPPNSVYFHYHPFLTSIPRWIGRGLMDGSGGEAPLSRMMGLLREHDLMGELRDKVEVRRGQDPQSLSLGLFQVWLAGPDSETGRALKEDLRQEQPPEKSFVHQSVWTAAENFFAEIPLID